MKTKLLLVAATLVVATAISATKVGAQECSGGLNCPKSSRMKYQPLGVRAVKMGMSFGHPHPVYAHSRAGITATRTHRWNQSQSQMRSWHAGYSSPAYGQPMALVVPPTASFQSVYSWGVGNTQSIPIYHQYGRPYPGAATGAHPGMYQSTPSQPWNTQQFGVYYSRAPW